MAKSVVLFAIVNNATDCRLARGCVAAAQTQGGANRFHDSCKGDPSNDSHTKCSSQARARLSTRQFQLTGARLLAQMWLSHHVLARTPYPAQSWVKKNRPLKFFQSPALILCCCHRPLLNPMSRRFPGRCLPRRRGHGMVFALSRQHASYHRSLRCPPLANARILLAELVYRARFRQCRSGGGGYCQRRSHHKWR